MVRSKSLAFALSISFMLIAACGGDDTNPLPDDPSSCKLTNVKASTLNLATASVYVLGLGEVGASILISFTYQGETFTRTFIVEDLQGEQNFAHSIPTTFKTIPEVLVTLTVSKSTCKTKVVTILAKLDPNW